MNSHRSAQIKQHFFEDNTNFREIDASEVSASKGFQNIDENEEEIWFLQCPKGLNIQNLEGHKLKFPGRINIKEFEATAMEATTPKTMSFGYARKQTYQVKLLPIAGRIVLREKLSAPQNITEENILESCPSTTVPMPEYIKLRHPLLGANFDEYLRLPTLKNTCTSDDYGKRAIKQEKSPKKNTHSILNEDSGKQLKSAKSEKRRKVQSSSLDDSKDSEWIKQL